MNIHFISLLISFLILTARNSGYAQKGNEVGGWLGTSYYFGDLNTKFKIQKPKPAGGFQVRRNFDKRVAVRSSVNVGYLTAADSLSDNNFERSRNLDFRSPIVDWSNCIEFNFFNYDHGSREEYATPYFFGGFNVTYFDPRSTLGGKTYKLRSLGTEGQIPGSEYNNITLGLLLGGGLKWDLSRQWSINIEASTRFLATDYLDDVSAQFPDKSALLSIRGPEAVALSDRSLVEGLGDAGRQRGDTKSRDRYTFVGISLMRYFGGVECPRISREDDSK
jgi:hypothetical protein